MATVEENKKLIADVLSTYPEKAAKKRAKHLGVYEEGKDDCGVKCPQPPPRQRVVQLLDAIPFMTGGLDAGELINFGFLSHRLVLFEWNLGCIVAVLLAAGAECPEDDEQEDQEHVQQAPAVCESAHGLVS